MIKDVGNLLMGQASLRRVRGVDVALRLFRDNQSRLRPGHRVRFDPAAALATAQLM
jgi:hypothetical protein